MRLGYSWRSGVPHARNTRVVGLLGGSFDPPHLGHLHITKLAFNRFALDEIWWLVSPGNPLKAQGPAPLSVRLEAAKKMVRDPRIVVSDIEAKIGTRHTARTLMDLNARYPSIQFVWLMGADNLATFHNWQQWREIVRTVPVGVIARPGQRTAAQCSKTATILHRRQLPSAYSRILAFQQLPRWCFVNVPMVNLSSTEIRAQGGWVS